MTRVKIFIDQCVPRSIAQSIQEAGFEVLHIRDHIPIDSPDPVVIDKARELDCALLSLNGDFADIITYPPQLYKGIIALQVRNHPESVPHIILRLRAYLESQPDSEHYHGKLLVVEAHRIRIMH